MDGDDGWIRNPAPADYDFRAFVEENNIQAGTNGPY
jgi:hypothetical protein